MRTIPHRARCLRRVVPSLGPVVAASLAVGASGQTITSTEPLSFGALIVTSGGSVTVPPSGGRSGSGVMLLEASQFAPAGAARFTLSGSGMVTVMLPGNDDVALTGPGGAEMPVSLFTSDPAGSIVLSGTPRELAVGCTLEVSAGQPPGSYSGMFTITIAYE